jgi:hypothetical protein
MKQKKELSKSEVRRIEHQKLAQKVANEIPMQDLPLGKNKPSYEGQGMPEPVTKSELRMLAKVHAAETGYDVEGDGGMIEQMEGAYLVKFPKYITGGPGYSGPVYLILWDGSPDYVTVVYEERLITKDCIEPFKTKPTKKLVMRHYGDF